MTTIKSGAILLMLISLWGCSTANDTPVTVDTSGNHPAGWAVASVGGNHPAAFLSAPDKCKECHGAELSGGISRVSCFSADRNGMSCHAQGPYGHPAGWSDPAAHGAHAKAAVSGVDGMAFCANCHGTDYRGAGAIGKDCLRCHTTAPHPPKPWTGATISHTTTNPGNAPVCAQCHTGRSNLSPEGLAKLPATAIIGAGGCFNNTLCHGVMGHEFPFPGSAHKSVGFDFGTYCIPCHTDVANAAGTYPVANGTPPVCSGCHSGWKTGNIGCGACHGDVNIATGQPNGTVFPNNAGRHASNVWHAVDCAVCHTGGGSGSPSHGNSNRIVKTRGDVTVRFTNGTSAAILSGMTFTRISGVVTCTGSCHSKQSGGKSRIHDSSDVWQ